jgi:hypothetical protein
MTANKEVEGIQKEAFMVYFTLLTLSCSNTIRGAEYVTTTGQDIISDDDDDDDEKFNLMVMILLLN